VIARRIVVAALALALLSGCAPHSSGDAKTHARELEAALETLPSVTGASAYVNPESVGLQVGIDAHREDDYLTALQQIAAVWAENPLAERKQLSLSASPEGTVAFYNVDPDDLDALLAAARILWYYSEDDAAEIASPSNYGYLASREFGVRLMVSEESLVAPTLAELTAMVEDAGLLYRPDGGLSVEVSP